MKYRRKVNEVEATQWFKYGDHPQVERLPNTFMEALPNVFPNVKVFPDISGERVCEKCGNVMKNHGWVRSVDSGGITVCPGDWVITGDNGEHYISESNIFNNIYEPINPEESEDDR